MTSEISKCPARNSDDVHVARFEQEAGDFSANCWGCGLTGPDCDTKEEAIAKWNRLHMRPEGVAVGDFGEPWRVDASDPDDVVIWDRTGKPGAPGGFVANCDESCRGGIFDSGLERAERAVACVNALAGLNPEAVAAYTEAVDDLIRIVLDQLSGFSGVGDDPGDRAKRAAVRANDALAKLKGGE